MGGVRDAFLTLLRAGLWGRDPMEEGFRRPGNEEWEQVLKMSGRQTVAGIVFDGICRLPDDLQPSPDLFARWVVAVTRIEGGNERMNVALKDLVKVFVDNGLSPVLQKGQGVAELYPAPRHRECGDIDFYFPESLSLRQAQRPENAAHQPEKTTNQPVAEPVEAPDKTATQPVAEPVEAPDKTANQPVAEPVEAPDNDRLLSLSKHRTMNDKAIDLVKSHGIKVETMPDGSQSYEWKGIEIEQHPTIVDLCSPAARKWIPELDGEPGYVPSDLADGLLVPSPELNALLLNTHILKHALGKGIGLRQMCDLAMLYHRICADGRRQECGERIFRLYRRAGILKWSRLLHSFLVGVIGLKEEELPYSEKVVSYWPLFRIVEDGGNFGQHRGKGSGCSGTSTSSVTGKISDRNGSGVSLEPRERNGSEGSGHFGTSTGSVTGRLSDRKRKFETAGMFLRRAGFSMRFAPKEAFWTFWELVKGQFRK